MDKLSFQNKRQYYWYLAQNTPVNKVDWFQVTNALPSVYHSWRKKKENHE
jgi:hypothetical protein